MVTLNKGQYLSDVMHEIPTNSILSKRIPGCGATTLELNTNHNSIIIVPNVPVINSKCQKDENNIILGVYEAVTIDDIAEYLREHNIYKIMTTPESFPKVKNACERCGLNIYRDFFLLDDECHQLVKDVDYREDIVKPMDDFFKFERKALVSATPIGFSDPRFKSFSTINISTDYDYRQKIQVIHTYSIAKTVREYLESHKDNKVCIFFNSVDGIYSLMSQLEILNNATVYCAPKSRFKLKSEHDFTNAYDVWSADTMKQYNFFTGRFYTAFDLELEQEKPDLLMITDPHLSPYTMLDVDTDCIQICGRFRNGISSATHIYRTDEEIVAKTRDELEWEISAHEYAYNTIQTFYNSADSRESRFAFGEALETLPFRKYLYPDLTKNWFAIDNAINEKLVESRYKYRGQVKLWYNDCHFFIPTFEDKPYNKHDEELKIIKVARSTKDKRRRMVQLLSELEDPDSEYAMDFINEIRKIDPTIVDAFELLGRERIEELDYSDKRIKEEIILKQRKGNKVVRLIKNSFTVGRAYTNDYITKELTRIFDMVHIHPEKPLKGSMIKDYFQTVDWRSNKSRGYRLVSVKI
ncbi:MAG: DEAD/DEAH box helicase family protein [Bacteroidaceae bacterium]|nr:DEAD/DEAH box helicase family protein [Bacteroidaceae bacterium]